MKYVKVCVPEHSFTDCWSHDELTVLDMNTPDIYTAS